MLKKPGRAVALAVGGAEESLLSRPHTLDLVLKKRQGFIRVALQTGIAAAAHHALILKWLTSWADSARTHMRSPILHAIVVLGNVGFGNRAFRLQYCRRAERLMLSPLVRCCTVEPCNVQCICVRVVMR